jgi:asparagine synthase (glutamine-hydrolysing)
MCGIAGLVGGEFGPEERGQRVTTMTRRLAHRGPDAEGGWDDPGLEVTLGHRRLSIIDCSESGAQPMVSASGRHVISINGEIYNYLELRARCTRKRWRGESDTEVFLELVGELGLDEALREAVGMFAFALVDKETRTLTLARDRMGEKPLYFGWSSGAFGFASEFRALTALNEFRTEIDWRSAHQFLQRGFVPSPWTMRTGVWKLPPGHTLTVPLAPASLVCPWDAGSWPGTFCGSGVTLRPYWTLAETLVAARAEPFIGSEDEAADELLRILLRSVDGQMRSDVPLGSLLSGGLDSSVLVALAQQLSARPIQTFTIAVPGSGLDESVAADEVARRLGTDHHTLPVTVTDAAAMVGDLPTWMDEPFADSSLLPTMLVARLARQHVTVVLSGDGGDEAFGGYDRYTQGPRLLSRLPATGSLTAHLLSWVGRMATTQAVRVAPLLARHGATRLLKAGAVLEAGNDVGRVRALSLLWPRPPIPQGARHPVGREVGAGWHKAIGSLDLVEQLMVQDTVEYLPDDILTKVDRASMRYSLESRAPYLDHRVIEFVWSLPLAYRVGGGQRKRVLRRVAHRFLPEGSFSHVKKGFSVPVGSWLRGELRDWAAPRFTASALGRLDFLDGGQVARMWRQHAKGESDWQYQLWSLAVLQAWLDAN